MGPGAGTGRWDGLGARVEVERVICTATENRDGLDSRMCREKVEFFGRFVISSRDLGTRGEGRTVSPRGRRRGVGTSLDCPRLPRERTRHFVGFHGTRYQPRETCPEDDVGTREPPTYIWVDVRPPPLYRRDPGVGTVSWTGNGP